MKFKAHEYQERAIWWVVDHPRCLLFLDMGLGKTVATLSAVQKLRGYGEVSKVLVIAPKKVAESTWATEAAKWDHLSLRVSTVIGTAKQRERALAEEADVYVTGRDTVVWLVERCAKLRQAFPFDMVVIDELTSFKNPRSLRFRALRKVLGRVDRVVGLTGTPTPNGLADLWAQVYCIDGGKRLGPFITHYRERWFNTVEHNNIVIRIWPKEGAEEEIRDKISDIALTMRAEDWLSLPDMIEHDVRVTLPDRVARGYLQFQKEKVLDLKELNGGNSEDIPAASAAALANKLSQYANGAVYDEERNVREIHDEKLHALAELLEADDSPVLCFYSYQHDRDRIMARFRELRPVAYKGDGELRAWNEGKVRLLLAHPASAAFGLNMQSGGHRIVWYSTGWNLELYQQANARLHRQGQQRPVTVHRLIAVGTIDERMAAAISGKGQTQAAFLKKLVRDLTKC